MGAPSIAPRQAVACIRDILQEHLHLEAVYLFGSRARGEGDRWSDYDVAVVSPDFEDVAFLERQRLVRPLVREALGTVPLDIVCYTPEEFERGRDGFLPEVVEREGVRA